MILTSAKNRLLPFILLELANFAGFFSGSMVFMLYPWLSLSVTGSSASAGLVVTITSIPGLLLAPVMGSFIDKFGRRRVAYLSETLTVLVSIAIPVIAGFTPISLFILIALGVIRSFIGFGGPSARKSLVPDVAEHAGISLERANSIHESIAAAGFATGPAVAALLLSSMNPFHTFYIVGAVGLFSGLCAWLIKVHERHEATDVSEHQSFIRYATQGFRTLFATPSVLIVLLAFVMLAVVYIPIEMIILPRYFSAQHNPEALGFLLTAMAATTSLSSLMFEFFSKRYKFSTIFRIGLLGVAIPVLIMSFLPNYFVLVVLGLILGYAWGPLAPLLNTVIQRKVPANERGRVFSLEMTIWSGGPMISMVLVGLAVDTLPLQTVYLAIAILTMVTALLVAFNRRTPELNTAEFAD